MDTIKSEMFGDFLQGLNSLEYSATQFEYFSDGSTSYDLPKILQGISLQDIIKLGRQFIDQAEMVDYMIFKSSTQCIKKGKHEEENDWSSVKTVKSKFTLEFTRCVK